MSEAVRQIIWKDWKTCYSVFRASMEVDDHGSAIYIDPSTFKFKGLPQIQKIGQKQEISLRPCLSTAMADLSSLSATSYFGFFVDAGLAINDLSVVDPKTLQDPNDKETWMSLLQAYQEKLFTPANDLVAQYSIVQKLTPTSTFALLAIPAARFSDLRDQVSNYTDTPVKCYSGESRDVRLYSLLCSSQVLTPDQQSSTLLDRPILAEMTVAISHWVMALPQFADLYDQQDQQQQRLYSSVDDIVAHGGGAGVGREMLKKVVQVLDVAIASYSQMYGGLTALSASEAIGGKTREVANAAKAIALLRQNSYLAENVAIVLLQGHRKDNGASTGKPLSKDLYRSAYTFAENTKVRPSFMLEGLFDDTLSFVVNGEGVPCIHLSAGDQAIDVPLPPPDEVSNGRFVFPPRFFQLLTARDQIVDRLFDYDVLSVAGTPPEKADEAAAVFIQ